MFIWHFNKSIYTILKFVIQADHKFTKDRAGGLKERAVLLMAKHVQAVHDIYRNTLFKVYGRETKGIFMKTVLVSFHYCGMNTKLFSYQPIPQAPQNIGCLVTGIRMFWNKFDN